MDYSRLPLDIRNNNIENIAVILNTLDIISFPNLNFLLKEDLKRFHFINKIQREMGNKIITKNEVYNYCVSIENK